jgi:diguanylate cyclase
MLTHQTSRVHSRLPNLAARPAAGLGVDPIKFRSKMPMVAVYASRAGEAVNIMDPARILIVDDTRAIHEDFRKILLNPKSDDGLRELDAAMFFDAGEASNRLIEFRVDSAYQGREALALVQRSILDCRPYSVAFIDMRMPPGWNGLETIERLWAFDPMLQMVICSAYSDNDWTNVFERLGRSDKLLVLKKPFDVVEVVQCAHALTAKWHNERALRRQLDSLEQDISERTRSLESANKQLRHLATHDALTSLPNRILLDDRMSQCIEQAKRVGEGFAVCVLDLDRFKHVNDSLGHRAGDEILKQVARRLQNVGRGADTVARIGGDEFVMILGQAQSPDDAARVGSKIVEEMREPIRVGVLDVHIAVSIGIAFYPADGATVETLYAHADAAMYFAKQRGGSAVECYSSSMNLATENRVRYEADLHRALNLQQFELHYQPKVSALTKQMHSVEALIRWRHPVDGLVPPDRFIPLAEESGLIVSIGEWVLREACRQVRAWQDLGLPAMRVAVNVSALQFRRLDLVETVQHALSDAGVDARYLEIELTETALMSNPEESVEILERLSRMGVIVSVDDFGTGYSSMSYLRRFPIDKLKIDRSFINHLMTSADDASIVRAIISLAHGLRLKVVAEGVETAEQVACLQKLGCDQFQGFYFSRPVTATAFEELLRSVADAGGAWSENETDRTQSRLAILRPAAKGQ